MARVLLLLVVVLGTVPACQAHRLSDACLRFRVAPDSLEGRIDIPIRDLAGVLPLDANGDRSVTWGELLRQRPQISEYVRSGVRLRTADRTGIDLTVTGLRVAEVAGEPCVSLAWSRPGPPPPGPIEIEYRLLADIDPHHRGLVRWEDGDHVQTAVLGPGQSTASFGGTATGGTGSRRLAAAGWARFIREGIHHIWTGYDHLLFLLALLLPAVLRRSGGVEPREREFGTTVLEVLRIVTAFTVAHSITLILAALKLVHLPSAPVEMAIAASVAIAAMDNLRPVFRRHAVGVAFAFGLIHGFGFAGVLEDLELPTARFVESLLGFNLGVELGQIAVVALFLPVAYALRGSWVYRRVALPWGSAAILLIALFWFGERTLAAGLFPG